MLKRLLFIHAIITLAASVVLIITPAAIPNTVGIVISADEYLLCYFLGAAELAIAFLSFLGREIEDRKSLRLISATFIIFHIATSALETFALVHGISSKISLNIILRVVIATLFWYYGIYKNKAAKSVAGKAN